MFYLQSSMLAACLDERVLIVRMTSNDVDYDFANLVFLILVPITLSSIIRMIFTYRNIQKEIIELVHVKKVVTLIFFVESWTALIIFAITRYLNLPLLTSILAISGTLIVVLLHSIYLFFRLKNINKV